MEDPEELPAIEVDDILLLDTFKKLISWLDKTDHPICSKEIKITCNGVFQYQIDLSRNMNPIDSGGCVSLHESCGELGDLSANIEQALENMNDLETAYLRGFDEDKANGEVE